MERLTTGIECYFVPKELIEVDECNMTIECKDCREMCEKVNNNCMECAIQTAFNKLAAYEDAAEQGLLIQKTDADITQIIKGKLLVLKRDAILSQSEMNEIRKNIMKQIAEGVLIVPNGFSYEFLNLQ